MGKVEDEVIDFADNLCTLSKREGRWLRRLDVLDTEDGGVTAKNMSDYGECRSECLLVRKACKAVLGNKQEDLVELIRAGSSVAALTNGICKSACRKKAKPLKHKRVDEAWMKGPDGGML